jgi:hypothetical protein
MVTRIGDEISERPVYRDPIGITSYGGVNGYNYKFTSPTGFEFELFFQTTNNGEAKANGLTNEVLLATLIDRLMIQNQKLPCRENERALDHLKDALSFLEARAARHVSILGLKSEFNTNAVVPISNLRLDELPMATGIPVAK